MTSAAILYKYFSNQTKSEDTHHFQGYFGGVVGAPFVGPPALDVFRLSLRPWLLWSRLPVPRAFMVLGLDKFFDESLAFAFLQLVMVVAHFAVASGSWQSQQLWFRDVVGVSAMFGTGAADGRAW